jgi:CMP-N,N'-diacetyllegionaminic acid synthase
VKILGVIPARGGSQRIQRKNLADLGGKPLISWTLEAAKKASIFNQLVVSSDDDEILAVAGKFSGVTCWRRSPELAQNSTPTKPVVMELFHEYPADMVVILQPTSPFRSSIDIVNALALMENKKGDSVFSVSDAPADLSFEIGHANRLRQVPNIVTPNGAIYILSKSTLDNNLDWYDGIVYGYSMPKDRSLDIDTEQDLMIARHLVSKGFNGETQD